MVLGIVVGYVCNVTAPDAEAAKDIAGYFNVVTDIFLRLIKMIIAPLVFATLVAGIASMGDAKAVGRIGAKALGWFVMRVAGVAGARADHSSTCCSPARRSRCRCPTHGGATNLKTSSLNLKDFITHVFPTQHRSRRWRTTPSCRSSCSRCSSASPSPRCKGQQATTLVALDRRAGARHAQAHRLRHAFAPFGVFAAVAAVITTQGLGVLVTYGKFIGGFYLGLAVLWLVLIAGGLRLPGRVGVHAAEAAARADAARLLHRQQRVGLPEDDGAAARSSA